MTEAVGMIEVYGLVAAFAACDAGCKAANVRVENFDKNKPGNPDSLKVPLIVLVKFRGSVEAVTAAVEAAEAEANRKVGESLTDDVLQNKYIEKWNGEMPLVTGGNGSLIQLPITAMEE